MLANFSSTPAASASLTTRLGRRDPAAVGANRARFRPSDIGSHVTPTGQAHGTSSRVDADDVGHHPHALVELDQAMA